MPDAVISSVRDAAPEQIADSPRPTTIVEAPRLAALLGVDVFLATETFQRTGSFKFRAAYNVALNVPNPHVIAALTPRVLPAVAQGSVRPIIDSILPFDQANGAADRMRDGSAHGKIILTVP